MELYNFNNDAYHEIIKIIKFSFFKQIKNTGIVFEEVLSAKNLATEKQFYILVCNDQEKRHYIRFREIKGLLLNLNQIAKKRLEKLKLFENELVKINNTEEYGESLYFNDIEMTAIGISKIKELLVHFDKRLKELNAKNAC
ncbi:hypothetical protein TOREUM_20669 [Tenacibaculum litoreum]|uniref:hypothetical protein n=1 Tax=Tenacibaculum litoreum TaxID=321269 RepID=UPI003894257B